MSFLEDAKAKEAEAKKEAATKQGSQQPKLPGMRVASENELRTLGLLKKLKSEAINFADVQLKMGRINIFELKGFDVLMENAMRNIHQEMIKMLQ